jgi:4-amino-4-deoxy-L-arabinose transferase-like glycosyltransferase
MRARTRFWSLRNRRRMFAIVWFAIVLIFFSCVSVKKDAYLLPVIPAQTLIIADAIATMRVAWRRRTANYQMSIVLAAAQCAIGIGFGIGLFLMLYEPKVRDAIALSVSGLGVLSAARVIWPIANHKPARWLFMQSVSYALLLITLIGFLASAKDDQRSPKPFARALGEYLETTDVPLLIARLPEEASFYLPLGLRDGENAPRILILIDQGPKDSPVDAQRLSELLDGAAVRGFQRVMLDADDGRGRYQLFDVIVNRNRA